MTDDRTEYPGTSIPDPDVLAELTPKTVVLDIASGRGHWFRYLGITERRNAAYHTDSVD